MKKPGERSPNDGVKTVTGDRQLPGAHEELWIESQHRMGL
jgi:hypothetical protein